MNESYYVDTSYGLSSTTGLFGAIAGMMALIWIIIVVIGIVQIVAMWKVFTKAGKPGWAAIIPIYNIYIMCEIAEKQWWYILLMCIPIVNIWAMFVVYNGIAKKFGKGTGFAIGMLFLAPIFFMILGFGKSNVYLDDNTNITNNNTDEANAVSVDEVVPSEPQTDVDQTQVNDISSGVGTEDIQTPTAEGYVAPSFDTPVMGQSMNQPINNFNDQASQMMEQAPVMNEPVAPSVEQALVMNGPVAQAVEQAPVMNGPVAPSVEQTPVMNEPVAQAVEQAPVMNEPVAQAVEQTSVMNEPVAQAVEQTPVMNEPVAQAVEQAPVMNGPVAPSVEQTPVMNGPVAQTVEQAPVMNEAANNVNEAPVLQQEVETLDTKPRTSLWSNNNNNNGQM